MKLKNHAIVLLVMFSCWALAASVFNRQKIKSNETLTQTADTLMRIQKINERCIIVRFGADAVTAINTNEGIVLIDAGISKALAAYYRKTAETHFNKNKFAYLINTHGHFDHVGGNDVFGDAKIVRHENCDKEISILRKRIEADPDKILANLSKTVDSFELQIKTLKQNSDEWEMAYTQKIRYHTAYLEAANYVAPKQTDMAFSDSLTLNVDNLVFELFYFGQCHTTSDILIFVPQLKILLSGDLFFNYGRPGIDEKLTIDKTNCLRSIQWISARKKSIENIIGGHGQLLTVDDLQDFCNEMLNKCTK